MRKGKTMTWICLVLCFILLSTSGVFVEGATEPDTYNMKEFSANQVDDVTDGTYMTLCGGIHLYNSNYAKKIPDGRVKITAKKAGIFVLNVMVEDKERVILYDKNNKKLATMDDDNDDFVKTDVLAGDVFYVQLPKKVDRVYLIAGVYKDHQTSLKNDATYTQTGTGQKEYRQFKITKRSRVLFGMETQKDGNKFYGRIQKLEGGTWKDITNSFPMTNSEYGGAGLGQGTYRFVVTVKKGLLYQLEYKRTSVKTNYSVRKKNARRIPLDDDRWNVFLQNEKRSRWYKITKKSYKRGDYLDVSSDINSGKLKITIYKQGKKKPVKTMSLYGVTHNAKEYVLPKGKGTYYIKVSKIGKKTNGDYSIEYESED